MILYRTSRREYVRIVTNKTEYINSNRTFQTIEIKVKLGIDLSILLSRREKKTEDIEPVTIGCCVMVEHEAKFAQLFACNDMLISFYAILNREALLYTLRYNGK